jgi:hypothetical protein
MKRALLVLLLVLASGCVERKLIVKTDPEDAVVEVDGLDLGKGDGQKPVELAFEHYGIRRVVVRAKGHAASEQLVELDPPWWQLLPFDFFTDVLWPGKLEDARTVEVRLGLAPAPGRADAVAVEERARAFAEQSEKRP